MKEKIFGISIVLVIALILYTSHFYNLTIGRLLNKRIKFDNTII